MCIYVRHSTGSYYAVAVSLVTLLPLSTAPMETFVTQSYKLWCFIWCWNWFHSSCRYAAAISTASEIRLLVMGPFLHLTSFNTSVQGAFKVILNSPQTLSLVAYGKPKKRHETSREQKGENVPNNFVKSSRCRQQELYRVLLPAYSTDSKILKSVALRSIASLGTHQYMIAPSFTFHLKFSAVEICITQPSPPPPKWNRS